MKTPLLIALILSLVLLIACTQITVVDLNESSETTTGTDELDPDQATQPDEAITSDDSMDEEIGSTIEQPAAIPVGPQPGQIIDGEGELKQALCPEQVLLAIRDCERLNGFLNVTLKNQLSNVSMVFYYIYDSVILSEEHSDEIVPSKATRSYIINLDSVEQQYGEVTKIEATPIYTKPDGSMIACANKKLPIIVKASCN